MVAPKPIVLTQVDVEDYTSVFEPQPYVVVGAIPGLAELVARVEALETP